MPSPQVPLQSIGQVRAVSFPVQQPSPRKESIQGGGEGKRQRKAAGGGWWLTLFSPRKALPCCTEGINPCPSSSSENPSPRASTPASFLLHTSTALLVQPLLLLYSNAFTVASPRALLSAIVPLKSIHCVASPRAMPPAIALLQGIHCTAGPRAMPPASARPYDHQCVAGPSRSPHMAEQSCGKNKHSSRQAGCLSKMPWHNATAAKQQSSAVQACKPCLHNAQRSQARPQCFPTCIPPYHIAITATSS